jgi:hypothetical protein
MSRLCRTLLAGLLLVATVANAATLNDGNVSIGGDTTITKPVSGNSVLIGGTVNVQAEISGNLVATAGTVNIQGAIGHNLVAGGGQLTLAAPVGGNARMFGSNVEITADGKVQGDASLAGSSVRVRGPIAGRLDLGGDDILIDSTVGGDVKASVRHIQLGPNANIMGKLRYSSAATLDRDPAAQVQGSIEHNAPDGRWQRWVGSHHSGDDDWDWNGGSWPWMGGPQWGSWMHPYHHYGTGFLGGLAILTALLIGALAPGLSQRLGATVDRQWGSAVLTGLATVIGAPILAVFLAITVIGIPIAVLVGAAWLVLMFLGFAASGVAFGEVALHRLAPARAHEAAMRVLAVVAAMILVIAAARTPLIGAMVSIVATLTGIGALLMQRRMGPPPAIPI